MSTDDDQRPHLYVHAEAPSDDEVRTFYEIPDQMANIIRSGWPDKTFNEALASKLGGQRPFSDEEDGSSSGGDIDNAATDHFDD